jgi:hypothetical protein
MSLFCHELVLDFGMATNWVPRAMLIFGLRIKAGKKQSEFCGSQKGGDGPSNLKNEYTAMMQLKRHARTSYEKLAEAICKHQQLPKVVWEQLKYDNDQLDLDDQVLQQLLTLDDEHPLIKLLSEHAKDIDRSIKSQRAIHTHMLMHLSAKAITVRNIIENQQNEWTEQQRADWAIVLALLDRTKTEATELKNDDDESRQILIEHAVEALSKDKVAEELLFKVLSTSGSTQKDSRHLVNLLFPSELESQAADNEMPKTLDAVFKLAHNLNRPLPELDTMCALRDVAVCLSIPRKIRFDAIRQYKQEMKIRHLPTVDIGISKQILCRALKLISKPKKQHVNSTELQLRFVNSNTSGERVLDVDASDLLALAKTQLLADTQADTQEPAGASLSSIDFYSHFSQGLAKALRLPYSEADQNTPPTYYEFINERLRLFDLVGIRICVFISLERTREELNQVGQWFSLLEIIQVREEHPLLFGKMRTTINTVNGLLDDRFGSGGTTDIM